MSLPKFCRLLTCNQLIPVVGKVGTSDRYNAGQALDVDSRCQTQSLSTAPHPGTPSASPSYQWLLVLIGFDAANKVGLAVGQDPHQLVQRLLELARKGEGALGGV